MAEKKIKITDKVKKLVQEHPNLVSAGLIAGSIAVYISLCVWEDKHLKTVSVEDWNKITGQGIFDELKFDSPIVDAFVTVEYENGEIGIIKDIWEVAKVIEEARGACPRSTQNHTVILLMTATWVM